jgi:hypothetical protein
MLSADMQRLLVAVHKQPFGIYMSDQKIYGHQRAFYRAVSYLEKYRMVDKVYIPVLNRTRLTLSPYGQMIAMLITQMVEDSDIKVKTDG